MLLARRLTAAILMGGVAGSISYMTIHSDAWLPVTAALGLGAVGFLRGSLGAQVASRAMAWLVFVPAAMNVALRLHGGHAPEASVLALGAASGAALLVARPLLHTKEAHEAFGPNRFRTLFLGGATVMSIAAYTWLLGAWYDLVAAHSVTLAAGAAGLAAALLLAVQGLLRMRAWGLVLAGVTSTALLAVAPFFGRGDGIALALTALPALLFWILPVLLARKSGEPSTRLRVSDVAEVKARVRIDVAPPLETPTTMDELDGVARLRAGS
jgi:hypothetical protein